MEDEICPVDDRRSVAEISLKLAVVHFTTLTAYCHFLSIRGEPTKVISRKMILFFVFPSSIIIQHVMAIVAIVSALILVPFKKSPDSMLLWSSVKRAPVVLFGAIDQRPSESFQRSSNRESVVKITGRVVVVLALITQCIGSCIIFARRYAHDPDAITIADSRVLDLAIATLLVSLLTIVHLVCQPAPRFNPHEILEQSKSPDSGGFTYLDAVLFRFREVPVTADSDVREDSRLRAKWQRDGLDVYCNATTTIAAYWAQPRENRKTLFSQLRLYTSGGLAGTLGIFGDKRTFCDDCAARLGFDIFYSVFQISFVTASAFFAAVELRRISSCAFPRIWTGTGWSRIAWRLLVLLPLFILGCGFATVRCSLIFITTLFPIWIVIMFLYLLLNLVIQFMRLVYWPTDLECPLLWSDPQANFLWHLM